MCHYYWSKDGEYWSNNNCSYKVGGNEVIYNYESKYSNSDEPCEGQKESEDSTTKEGGKEAKEDGGNSNDVICISDCERHVGVGGRRR